jgi:type IV pilus assembly protein PilA
MTLTTHETCFLRPNDAMGILDGRFDHSGRLLARDVSSAPGRGRLPRGFSLVELLIVIAIILIIAAIAIPNLLKAERAANESAAVGSIRTIGTAAVVYSSTWSNGFPPSFATFGGLGGSAGTCDFANLLDPGLVGSPSEKNGYEFAYQVVGAPVTQAPGCSSPGYNQFVITAVPISLGLTGSRSFCSDQQNVIHYDTSGAQAGSDTICDALPNI